MNKGIVITLIILLSILAIGLIIGFIFLLNNNFNFNFKFDFNGKDMELIESKEVKVDTIKNIEFKLKSMDVEIKQSEDDNIKVELYSNTDDNPKIEVVNDVIKVDQQNNKNINFGINMNRRKLVVYVPQEYAGEYNISLSSGDVKSEIDMSKNKVNMAATSGDLKLGDVGECNITTTSGNIKLGTAQDNLNVATTSGNIQVEKVTKVIKAKATSGNVIVNELNIKENSSIEVKSGNIEVNNNVSGCYVNASTRSGNSKVNKSDRMSTIELKLETTSGNIKVD